MYIIDSIKEVGDFAGFFVSGRSFFYRISWLAQMSSEMPNILHYFD